MMISSAMGTCRSPGRRRSCERLAAARRRAKGLTAAGSAATSCAKWQADQWSAAKATFGGGVVVAQRPRARAARRKAAADGGRSQRGGLALKADAVAAARPARCSGTAATSSRV